MPIEKVQDLASPILVTGGAGFIGSHLVEQLVARGAQVTVVDNLSTGRLENLQAVMPQIEFVPRDLGNLLQTGRLEIDQYACIFHLAANPYIPPSVENPAFDYQANLHTTFLLLETLRHLPHPPRLINISSAAVYGNPASLPIRETDPTVPISPYGVSKLAGERYAAVYSELYSIRATSLRFFSVYGPRQRKQVVYDLLCKLRANPTELHLLGNGSQARDFTYVRDLVQAMLLTAAAAPARGETYNVASGVTYSIADLAQTLCRLRGLAPKIIYSGQVRPGDAARWVVDVTRLKALGYEPQTALEEGLRAIQEWFDASVP